MTFFLHSDELGCNGKDNYPNKKTIRYSINIRNKTNRIVNNAKLWTLAPVKKTATQKCGRIEASYPFELIIDDFGNQTISFTFENIPPFSTRIVSIEAVLDLTDIANCSAEETDRYLLPETYIESNSAEIRILAAKLVDKTTVSTVEKIFSWVAENIRYDGYRSSEKGALLALQTKKGDCTEYMRLFVALCRASGIPSRSIGGYVCLDNNIVTPVDYHNWGEFYMGGTWHIADPQKKTFMEHGSDYIAMQIIAESSDRLMKGFRRYWFEGDGLEVKMNS